MEALRIAVAVIVGAFLLLLGAVSWELAGRETEAKRPADWYRGFGALLLVIGALCWVLI